MSQNFRQLLLRPSGATLLADRLEQPDLDNRSYRVIQLPNKLEALIVHDPDTDKASAALDVHAGNFSDKDDLPGQAHAVEHLLFMGTEKYPKENEYSQYLAENSGHSNAYTASTSTNYYFEVGHEAFYGALDRFAQFFIAPLFLAETLDRELRAVDSENKKNLQNDTWRNHQLSKTLSNPKHPYCHFSTGNLETLKDGPASRGVNVRDEFLKFHEKYYSANVMKLVVLGREDLNTLEKWVIEYFQGVKNKNLPDPQFNGQPFTEKELLTQIFSKPVMDSRSLEITFPYLDEEALFRTQPSRYASHLIGHEGPGSILALLKKKGWANGLSAGSSPVCNDAAFFSIGITLTEDGLENYEEVTKIVFEYIHLIRSTPPQEWVVKELQAVSAIDFKFRQKSPASKFTSRLSAIMQKPLPREWLLSGTSLIREFDAGLITKSLQYLNPTNFRIHIVSRDCPRGNWEAKEKWYGTEYRVEKMTDKTLREIQAIFKKSPQNLDSELHLPHKNEFIPGNFEVQRKEVKEPQKVPALIRNTELSRVWYKKDDTFWVPKANINCGLRNPMINASPGNVVKARLYCELVRDSLNEYAYDAGISGLQYSLQVYFFGFGIDISGYNDKMLVLMEKVLVKMRDLEVLPDRFKLIKEKLLRRYRNWDFAQPYYQVGEYARYLHTQDMWLNEEHLEELAHVTLEDVKSFFPQALQKFHLEALVHGNLYKEDALRLTTLIENTLKPRALPPSQFEIRRSLIMPPGGKFIYPRILKDEKNVNSCIEYSLYIGECTDKKLRALSILFAQLTEEPAFDQLRTKEQLGYVVFSGGRLNITTLTYRVLIQSERSAPYLESRIENFLANYKVTLEKMTEKELQGHINSVIVKRTEKMKNLDQESARLFNYIINEYYDFSQIDTEVEFLRSVTKDDIMDFYNNLIDPASPTRSKISVHMHAAATPQGVLDPTVPMQQNNVLVEELCSYISLQAGKRADPLAVSRALTCVDITKPESVLSALSRYLLDDLKLSKEKVGVIVTEMAPVMAKLLPQLVKVDEEIADQGEIIEDVHDFKRSLEMSRGPSPVKPLVEFEESSVKL